MKREDVNKKEYLIVPGCDDTNRGDQALIWETVEIAKKAGFDGRYYMIAREECSEQSKVEGIESLPFILPHPSMHIHTNKDNRKYKLFIKFQWGLYALGDLLIVAPLTNKWIRPIAEKIISKTQQKTLKKYKNISAAFVKGGGFLHAYEGITDIYKIYFFLFHINLALSMGIPVYVLPNSYGPFKSKIVRRMVRKCLSKCKIIYARESISQKMLADECHVESLLSKDLAMYLEKDESINTIDVLSSFGIEYISGKMVGLTVRPYRFPGKENAKKFYEQYKGSIIKLIIWLKKNSYNPVLIEHVFSNNFHERDMLCIQEIKDEIETMGFNIDVFSNLVLNCREMKSIYSSFNYIIGTRFHSVIFSMTEEVPCIAITYGGNKGEGIMKDMDLSKYAIRMDEINGDKLISKFKELLNEEKDIRNKLKQHKNNIIREKEEIITAIRRV